MRIETKDLAIGAVLAAAVILTDSWIAASIIIVLAIGFLLGSDHAPNQHRLAIAVFFWGVFTFFSQGNEWYRAQYDIPMVQREYFYRKVATEAGVALSAWAQRPLEDGGGGGKFVFLKSLTPEELNIFPSNPVWTYRMSMPNDTLLYLYMILKEDNGSEPLFQNANGDLGRQQYRMDITPGEVPDIIVEN